MFGLVNLIGNRVYAQTVGADLVDPLNGQVTTLANVYAFIFNLIVGIAWAMVFIMTVVNINRYILSKGEPKEVMAVHTAFYYLAAAGFGLFLVTVSKSIILSLLGVSSLNTGPESGFMQGDGSGGGGGSGGSGGGGGSLEF